MIATIITGIVKILTGPLVSLGDKYLDNQKDKERLQQGTDRLVYQTDAAVRTAKWNVTSWLGALARLPLFIAETAASAYFILVIADSTWLWRHDGITLAFELPEWFKPHFAIAMASIFGIATVDRFLNKRR